MNRCAECATPGIASLCWRCGNVDPAAAIAVQERTNDLIRVLCSRSGLAGLASLLLCIAGIAYPALIYMATLIAASLLLIRRT